MINLDWQKDVLSKILSVHFIERLIIQNSYVSSD